MDNRSIGNVLRKWPRPAGVAEAIDADQVSNQVTGYLHPGYADSLSEFGSPCHLPRSRGWILKRHIPRSDFKDAMGSYPLFSCVDWSSLVDDLEDFRSEL